ncbi:MAG: hypothetical protein ACTJFX_08645 [Pseudoalteromonas prydzensis]
MENKLTSLEKLLLIMSNGSKREPHKQVALSLNVIVALLLLVIGAGGYLMVSALDFATQLKVIIPSLVIGYAINTLLSVLRDSKKSKSRIINMLQH